MEKVSQGCAAVPDAKCVGGLKAQRAGSGMDGV